MDLKYLEKLCNEKTIVLLPKHDSYLTPYLEKVIGKVFIIDDSFPKSFCTELINKMNDISFENLIFVNYNIYFREIIPNIFIRTKVKWLITHPVASFTNINIYSIFYNIMEFYDRFLVKSIICCEKGLYALLSKKGYNTELVDLNIKINQVNSYNPDLSIGIISNDFDPKHGFYNMLTALKLVNYNKVKLISHTNTTEHFLKFFNLKYELYLDVEEVMKGNIVNLYCNFTNSNNILILKSLDMGIPCIVGNCDLFDNSPVLKQYLVLKSDDDVNEIAEKIENAIKNHDIIIEEYKNLNIK